jgi:undecaprenyl diphosphate synthase
LVLCIAWNYGGRDEIICAIQNLIADGIKPEQISEELVSNYMFTVGIPDPDLIIRTSGEMRISNFLIWQSAYSEWYITPTLWPDFNREELYKALQAYSQRDRRFGKLTNGCEKD